MTDGECCVAGCSAACGAGWVEPVAFAAGVDAAPFAGGVWFGDRMGYKRNKKDLDLWEKSEEKIDKYATIQHECTHCIMTIIYEILASFWLL